MSTPKIPISAAKEVARTHEMTQVIILGWDGESTHITTYGKTAIDCDQAAQGANFLKVLWNWPKSTIVDPFRVRGMKKRIQELENETAALREALERIDPVTRKIVFP